MRETVESVDFGQYGSFETFSDDTFFAHDLACDLKSGISIDGQSDDSECSPAIFDRKLFAERQ